jgi:hypothetical protein
VPTIPIEGGGGKFLSGAFTKYCIETRVHHQLTTLYSAQQNGVVERMNQTVVAAARSMMKAKNLLGYFWGETITTDVYLLNMSQTKSVVGMPPYEAWNGWKSRVSHLRTFRCIAYVKNTKPHPRKLDDRNSKMIFVGYEEGSKVYHAYNPGTRCMHVTCDIMFDELAQWY